MPPATGAGATARQGWSGAFATCLATMASIASFVACFVGALLSAYGLTLATAVLCACTRRRPVADAAPDDVS